MTFDNTILLILKQKSNAEFNELFSIISNRYMNSASANAALSRSLKNLESLGKIKREGSRIFITDKGLASIHIEMKEKLVLRLNEIINKPIQKIDEVVQLLIVLTERANESPDLLQNARENSLFTIKTISDLQEKLDERQEFLGKMNSLLGMQEERLRELNFNDERVFDFNEELIRKIVLFSGVEKISMDIRTKEVIEKIPELFKKEDLFFVDNEFKEKVLKIVLSEPLAELTIYIPKMRIAVQRGRANCFAPFQTIKQFEEI